MLYQGLDKEILLPEITPLCVWSWVLRKDVAEWPLGSCHCNIVDTMLTVELLAWLYQLGNKHICTMYACIEVCCTGLLFSVIWIILSL